MTVVVWLLDEHWKSTETWFSLKVFNYSPCSSIFFVPLCLFEKKLRQHQQKKSEAAAATWSFCFILTLHIITRDDVSKEES